MTNMFGHHVRSDLLMLYLAEGIAVFFAAFAVLEWMTVRDGTLGNADALLIATCLALCSGLVLGATGLYQQVRLTHAKRLAISTAVAVALMVAIAVLALALILPGGISVSTFGLVWLLPLGVILAVAAARGVHAAVLRHGLLRRRLLIVGEGSGEDGALLDAARNGPNALTSDSQPARLARADLAQAMRPGWLRDRGIWAVVLPGPAEKEGAFRQHCGGLGVQILSEEQLHECNHNRVECDRLPVNWLGNARAIRQSGLEAVLRRGFDIAVTLTLLLLTLPLMVLTAILIRIDSNGPVFYRQERCGLQGEVFWLFKFRSMAVDAEVPGKPVWATKADPRVTRFGRFMRLTRIDELPQLINVLRGDMSMVGPRPERPGFVAQLGEAIPRYHDRASVKPGITGWAQVNYPYGASVEDARMKLAYDLYYVRHRSLFLDMLILLATVRVVLFQEGAR